MTVVTRIAPSPTGFLHFGLARTALFNYLYAKKTGGEFVIRIEDTDTARNKSEYEEDINEQLAWLGLEPTRRYRQSEHVARHKECLQSLIANGKAYLSKEPAKDDATREVEVVRLKNPGEKITFTDGIRGDITFDTTELKDFVIARSVYEPLYHFAVVVDDHDEGVTHVIRGDDHISNTPRQMLILKVLGFDIPSYTHLPLILMPDKSKMSKRKHETSVKRYREMGILPQALLNYIALLGWTPPSGKEMLSIAEMVSEFELGDLHKSGAVFDIAKLRWYNREYLKFLSENDFAAYALPILEKSMMERKLPYSAEVGKKLLPVIRERIETASDIEEMTSAGEFDFFVAEPMIDTAKLPQKNSSAEVAAQHLEYVHELWSATPAESFSDPERLKESVWEYATKEGRGNVLWPLRYALSGKEKSPDPFMIASILGKDTALARIAAARHALSI
ncbi:MAG: glutamate--tRNA ligase [Candidatus Kaiserbacteria bacterium]|nr:glutamate--tRNA ligase [Candidatus Kaiserbacteria bacterium]